jgi:hypothetical protein
MFINFFLLSKPKLIAYLKYFRGNYTGASYYCSRAAHCLLKAKGRNNYLIQTCIGISSMYLKDEHAIISLQDAWEHQGQSSDITSTMFTVTRDVSINSIKNIITEYLYA